MIDDFIERKWGRRKVEYMLPELEGILKESLGVIVYQEQVMRIAQGAGELSAWARRTCCAAPWEKRTPKAMAKQRDRFMSGAEELGYPKEALERSSTRWTKFRSMDSTSRTPRRMRWVAYQTAYLKTHYPVEFMAALLTSETSKPDSVVKYIGECREMGIAVEPPDVQVSGAQFTPQSRRGHPLRAGRGEERRRQRH